MVREGNKTPDSHHLLSWSLALASMEGAGEMFANGFSSLATVSWVWNVSSPFTSTEFFHIKSGQRLNSHQNTNQNATKFVKFSIIITLAVKKKPTLNKLALAEPRPFPCFDPSRRSISAVWGRLWTQHSGATIPFEGLGFSFSFWETEAGERKDAWALRLNPSYLVYSVKTWKEVRR